MNHRSERHAALDRFCCDSRCSQGDECPQFPRPAESKSWRYADYAVFGIALLCLVGWLAGVFA
jgi:hypothetical protein